MPRPAEHWRPSPAGTGRVLSIAFSPDGKHFAAASGRTAKLFDTRSGRPIFSMSHDEGIYCVSFSPDGKRIVTSSSDQTVKLWDTKTGFEVLSMPFAESIYGAHFGRDGKRLYVLPIGKEVRVFDSTQR
jgi:WD40 repeat protein